MMERFLPPTPNMSQHSLASFLNFFILYFIYTTRLTHPDTLAQRQVERKFKSNPRSSGKKKNWFMEPKIVLPNNIYIMEKSPNIYWKIKKLSAPFGQKDFLCPPWDSRFENSLCWGPTRNSPTDYFQLLWIFCASVKQEAGVGTSPWIDGLL